MAKDKLPDGKLLSEEDLEEEEEDYETAKAKHLVKTYKCYGCGKTEIGKNLDDLYKNHLDDSWYFEFSDGGFDVYPQIYRLPLPQPGVNIRRDYCNKCGKIRERELELFRIEHRKMKALEQIGSALQNITGAMPGMTGIGNALQNIAEAIPSDTGVAIALDNVARAIRQSPL